MQLSGGERSFSTMAYISALRQIMPTPFFMLDEFEVFMDGGNKRVSMGILVEQAHSLFDAQFFVFTPHEPDELPQDDDYIKYYK
jgi:chromosome segregation ATPase